MSCSMSCSSIREMEDEECMELGSEMMDERIDEMNEMTDMLDMDDVCSCGGMGLCSACSCTQHAQHGSASALSSSHRRPRLRPWNYPWWRSHLRDGHSSHLPPAHDAKPHRGLRLPLRWDYPWGQQRELELPDEDLKGSGGQLKGNKLRILQRWRNFRKNVRLPVPRWRGPTYMYRLRPAEKERPKKRQFFLALSVVIVLFLSLFWRRLKLHRVVFQSLMTEERVCRRSNLSVGPWRYCGPSNFHDFSGTPTDVLDTICAQHDFCIERAEYLVEGRPRKLYPMGETDEDGTQRCGIPMRSHTNPNFGCQISACDREMLESLKNGFKCADDPSMPKGPWCQDSRFLGQSHCSEHRWTWKYLACQTVASVAKAYHGWKVRSTCNSMSRQMRRLIDQLDDEDNRPSRGLRSKTRGLRLGTVLLKAWEFFRGDVASNSHSPIAWNCTCEDRRNEDFGGVDLKLKR